MVYCCSTSCCHICRTTWCPSRHLAFASCRPVCTYHLDWCRHVYWADQMAPTVVAELQTQVGLATAHCRCKRRPRPSRQHQQLAAPPPPQQRRQLHHPRPQLESASGQRHGAPRRSGRHPPNGRQSEVRTGQYVGKSAKPRGVYTHAYGFCSSGCMNGECPLNGVSVYTLLYSIAEPSGSGSISDQGRRKSNCARNNSRIEVKMAAMRGKL